MKPPVTIEILMSSWTEDSVIDSTSMEKELLKISHLHGKYLNVMSYHRDLEERGWEPMQHVLSNPQIARKLETDAELNKLLLKKVAHEEIVSYCENVLKSLHSRTWDLGT